MIYIVAVLGIVNTVLVLILSRAIASLSRALLEHVHNGFR